MKKRKSIVRAIMAILLALCMFMAISSCGNNQSKEGNGTDGKLQVAVKDFYVIDQGSGSDTLVVTYTFTNNSDKAEAFGYHYSYEVYQNGIALDRDFVYGLENNNAYNDVKPGYSADISVPYQLSDANADIEIEITNYGTGKCILSGTFSLTDKE